MQESEYKVSAQGIIDKARDHVDPQRGISLIFATFDGMSWELAKAIYDGDVKVTCVGDKITKITAISY